MPCLRTSKTLCKQIRSSLWQTVTDDKLTKWNVNPAITQSHRKLENLGCYLYFTEWVLLPTIFVMADTHIKNSARPQPPQFYRNRGSFIFSMHVFQNTLLFFFKKTISLSILCVYEFCGNRLSKSFSFLFSRACAPSTT